jgi:hypothetical protein
MVVAAVAAVKVVAVVANALEASVADSGLEAQPGTGSTAPVDTSQV